MNIFRREPSALYQDPIKAGDARFCRIKSGLGTGKVVRLPVVIIMGGYGGPWVSWGGMGIFSMGMSGAVLRVWPSSQTLGTMSA